MQSTDFFIEDGDVSRLDLLRFLVAQIYSESLVSSVYVMLGEDFRIEIQPTIEGRFTVADKTLIERLITAATSSVVDIPSGTDGDALDRLVGTKIKIEVMTPSGRVAAHLGLFTSFDVVFNEDGKVIEGEIHLSPELWNQITAARNASY